jgi:non-homologous end joining protein Ku
MCGNLEKNVVIQKLLIDYRVDPKNTLRFARENKFDEKMLESLQKIIDEQERKREEKLQRDREREEVMKAELARRP